MSRREEFHSALERGDAKALRRMAEEAPKEQTRMLLKLLAEVVDQHPKRARC
jgi:hypothetical protein